AFRHPYGDEPQMMFHVMETMIPRLARRMQKPLKHSPRMRPVHDYAVALWGDAVIRFVLPRVGALPVYHIKFDSESLSAIRAVMRDGESPLGIASEGQISYHSETLPRIEQGTIRMGFWCARDIEKAGRSERVIVLPLSVHYRYDARDSWKIGQAVKRIESLCGLKSDAARSADATPESLLPRIDAIESRLLEMTEAFYASSYGYRPSGAETLHDRWMAMLPFALSVAEHTLGIDPGNGDVVQRMYRVRLEGWERIYPQSAVEGLTPLQAALADRRAGEAWYAMRHMELVDLMNYHDANYFCAARPSSLTFDRLVETVFTLEDLANRLMGGNITNRPNAIRKNAVIVPGEAMDLTANLPAYHANARQTVQALTGELAGKFTDCIEVYHNGKS
ncbi:MAG: hypothetical protein ABIK64_07615, partial [Bacillota bacterium]